MIQVKAFFEKDTSTLTYVVWDPKTLDAVVIDPVLGYDAVAVRTDTAAVDEVGDFVQAQGLTLRWVLETHVHADHLSGSQVLKERFGAGVVIGEHIRDVQAVFSGVFNMQDHFAADGAQFDRLVAHGETLPAGSLDILAIHTPGHTPACVTWKIGDSVFAGDTMFMPDFGTGRCDFPGGSAETLYDSVTERLYTLPDDTPVYVGHDYQPGGRALEWRTTIGACKTSNKQLRGDTPKTEFVKFRSERDAVLKLPRLIFQSLRVNMEAGHLPEPESNGQRYLKLPLNAL